MKNLLIFIALTSLTFAGAAQNSQTKKSESKKTTTAKKSPTPAKKTPTTAKKTPAKKDTAVKKPAAKTATTTKPTPKTTPKPTPVKKDDKGDLEKALAFEKPDDKIAALTKFLADHPKSELRPRALESRTAARVVAAEAKFDAGEREAAVKLYRVALKEAPVPYPERLFNEVISKAPQALYFRGEQTAAVEIAAAIESNSAASVPQMLAVATSYLMMEIGDEAKRLAEAALKLDEKSSAAYQVLGMANRLNFDLDASAAAFSKSLELDPESLAARRGLAEMKRALGKPDEALALFDELLVKDAEDFSARNGRILSLFATGKRADAEAELAKAIEANPSNVPLLAGAAYIYAANGESQKAIDLAGKAIAADPRYIWSHVALGRAYILEGRFSEAEQALLGARKYGNFATLEYEIAAARLTGGFYREAAEELRKSFVVKDGMVSTKLGRRVERTEKSFSDLIAYERRASILEPKSADDPEQAETLKALLEFHAVLSAPQPDQTKAAQFADAFVKGSDKMRYHRQIYAANELLEKKVAPAKAIELSKAAVASVDDGLAIALPAAPIMASELYSNRVAAINTDRYVIVPDVPKQTLSAIARGRIEEIAGWSLLQQGRNLDAVIRLRRAVSILPEKSVWWRSSYWRLGQALEAEGKDKDALDAYVKSYNAGDPESAKYATVESIYRKTNGNTDGLEALIGANPVKPEEKKQEEKPTVVTETKTEAKANENPVASTPEIKTEEKPAEAKKEEEKSLPVSETKTEEKPSVNPPAPTPEVKLEEKPVETKKQETEPQPKKPLFDPVVIEIKHDPLPVRKSDTKTDDKKTDAEKKAEPEETKGSTSTNERPRVIEGKEIKADAPVCTIKVSQENISLIGGGGSVGILVGVDGGDAKQLTAAASSPKDIEVVPDPEPAAGSGKLLFVIKSLTTSTGVYQVVFSTPCGKKELIVKVR